MNSDSLNYYVDNNEDSFLLPEIVLKFITPRNAYNFLIGFLLRFVCFHTEIDLFSSVNIIDSYRYAKLIESKSSYTPSDVNKLVKLYLLNVFRYQLGGVLPFSSKTIVAKKVFRDLLHVSFADTFSTPTVLINDIHSQAMVHVEQFIKSSQEHMLERVSELGINNLQVNPLDWKTYWEPQFVICDGQQQ